MAEHELKQEVSNLTNYAACTQISPVPANEASRLAALRSYEILDTVCEVAFDNITELAAKFTDCPISLVSLVDAERLWFKSRYGLDVTEMPRDFSFCAYAITAPDELFVVEDATVDQRFVNNWVVTGTAHVRFYAAAPLINPDGFTLGTLCVIDNKPREMNEEARDALAKLAQAVTTTMELQRVTHEVHRMAMSDLLTGVANRAAFLQALGRNIAQLRRHGNIFTLVYIDLDGFKAVNDMQGHTAGDQVLREIASTLTITVRQEDIVARIGGDEFVVILVGNNVNASMAAERIRFQIESRMRTAGWPVTASMGAITFLAPPQDAVEALAVADNLMYKAKLAGKNCALHCEYKEIQSN